eukprot:3780803-Amphidinium_carterae.1
MAGLEDNTVNSKRGNVQCPQAPELSFTEVWKPWIRIVTIVLSRGTLWLRQATTAATTCAGATSCQCSKCSPGGEHANYVAQQKPLDKHRKEIQQFGSNVERIHN